MSHDDDHVDREVREVRYTEVERKRGGFVWGAIAAVVAIVIAVGVFLVVSDSDDDGTINVPTVDVDADINAE